MLVVFFDITPSLKEQKEQLLDSLADRSEGSEFQTKFRVNVSQLCIGQSYSIMYRMRELNRYWKGPWTLYDPNMNA